MRTQPDDCPTCEDLLDCDPCGACQTCHEPCTCGDGMSDGSDLAYEGWDGGW